MPTVAIASEFLDAYARIPRAQQKKVREFTETFQANPTSAAIHYEKIQSVRDEKVRTVRIDQKYRAVVLHPEQGDVYVLVWVDNHDEAMAWACPGMRIDWAGVSRKSLYQPGLIATSATSQSVKRGCQPMSSFTS